MAKILISFLGTGPVQESTKSSERKYRKAKYSVDGEYAGESPFVASVLMDYYQFDGLMLIGTARSLWEEAYRYFSDKKSVGFDEDAYYQLAIKTDTATHKSAPEEIDLSVLIQVLGEHSDAVCIPYGLNREEQLQIFSRVGKMFQKLNPGDEVVLDVTHSFRSLPLFATTVIHFMKSFSKEIKFEKVYYGMLDAQHEFGNTAPIIDISSTLELQNWTTAAHSFKEYGKGKLLAELLGDEKGKIVKIFSDAVNINYLHEIQTRLANFQQEAEKGFDDVFAQWVVPEVLKSFTEKLQKAGNQHHLFQLELSVWHYERQNFASAYIVFVESIITYVCEKSGYEWRQMDHREQAKIEIVQKDKFKLKKLYETANKPRKNIAHNLSRRGNMIQRDIDAFPLLQKEFRTLIK